MSLFSGIEAASVAAAPLGWEPVAFAEVEPFCCSVLAEHFPGVPNLGDVAEIDWKEFLRERGAVELVVGGSPCQSFSVAGNREGLAGESGLMFEYVRAVRELMPRWFLWENVPGALSSEYGAAFGQLLREMDALGYGLAWRVLDAQFFGVAQRRERVFLVGCLGDVRRAAEVLIEREGLRWDNPPSRDKRKELAARAGKGATEAGGALTPNDRNSPIVAFAANQRGELRLQNGDGSIVGAIPASQSGKQVQGVCYGVRTSNTSANGCGVMEETSHTLDTSCSEAVCCTLQVRCGKGSGGKGALVQEDMAFTITTVTPSFQTLFQPADDGYVVRRLMPVECERLQGFPDGWTNVEHRGKPAADTPRYRALGNSMAVPVMQWIFQRIAAVEVIG